MFMHGGGRLALQSRWKWEVWNRGELIQQSPIWRVNLVVGQGLDHALDAIFLNGTSFATWYCMLFENNYTVLTGDTYQVPGFTECTAYDEANRQTVSFGAIASHSIDNSASRASFTMNATKDLWGAALVAGPNAATKSNVAAGNFLMLAVNFGAAVPVIATDVFKLTCDMTTSDVP